MSVEASQMESSQTGEPSLRHVHQPHLLDECTLYAKTQSVE